VAGKSIQQRGIEIAPDNGKESSHSAHGNGIASTRFERLFAHHQEALYVQQLVCFVCIMSAGW
jgi:hypothetical protein